MTKIQNDKMSNETASKSLVGDNSEHSIDPEELLSSEEAAKLLHQKPQTLAAWRSQRRGPEFYKLGRSVFYSRIGLRAHVAASRIIPTVQTEASLKPDRA